MPFSQRVQRLLPQLPSSLTGYTNSDSMKTFITLVKKKGVETAIPPLQGLKAAAELASIPALGPATDIILSILEIAYQSQQNAGTCREIANRCLRAHVTLSQHLESVEITEKLLKSIRQFEADLHEVQELVEKYRYKKTFRRLFYSKSDNDELQRLGKQVDETLLLFQIKELLSLGEICERNNASLKRIEQNIVVLMNRDSAPKPEGASVDIFPRNHLTLCDEIINRPGYSLQTAEVRSGKIVTIRVFTGCNAKSTWEASNKFDLNVMHPNLPHLIGTSSSDERGGPYSVYDLDIKDSVEGVILSWMSQDVDEIMYMCAGMIHGISSALNSLSEQARLFDMDAESFDILWDARGRVILSLRPEVATSSTALASPEDHTKLRLLRVMDDICVKIFRGVNRIRYDDEPDRTYTISSITQVDEDTSSLASSSQPSRTTVIQPRRELVWRGGAGRDTDLHKISQEYGSFVRRDKDSRQHVRRFHAHVGNPFLHHQCAAHYRREDLTLIHAILDNRVVVFTEPSFGEVCVVCGTVPSAWPPPEPMPPPEFPPARPGWRTVNVRPSKKKKRDSGLPPPAAPPPGPDPRAQVRDWAQWHPEPYFVPTPPAIEPQLLVPDQGSPGLFGPRSPRGSIVVEDYGFPATGPTA